MKKDEFRRLAEDVANCHICEKMMTLPHIQNSECLVNDTHGLDTDRPYVNRWNLWQGDLDADDAQGKRWILQAVSPDPQARH